MARARGGRQRGGRGDGVALRAAVGLRVDINAELHGGALLACPLFQECDPMCVVMLSQQLVPVICMPSEVIIKEKMMGYCMYFINRGQVSINVNYGTPQERMVGTLGAGSFFGEVAITKAGGAERGATCIARTLLMQEKLTRQALEHVAESFRDVIASVRKVAMERRRELGEEIRSVTGVATNARVMSKFILKLSKGRLARGQPRGQRRRHPCAEVLQAGQHVACARGGGDGVPLGGEARQEGRRDGQRRRLL